MQWKVQLFELNYDEDEVKAVQEVLRSGWLTMGEKTREFERRFAEVLGSGVGAVAVSSGTAALHMAMLALGVGPGDEVIVSALTFIADANAVRMVGAKPVLADCVSYEDWNLDPEDVAGKVTSRTKAIIAVHYAGYPCAMAELLEVCAEHDIALVEDAAHAVGAAYHGRMCGTLGRIGCFSFFSNKNLSVGEGGMFASTSEETVRKGALLRSHGMSTLTLDRHEGRAITYDVLTPGLNYRIDEIRAALGLVQLERLRLSNQRRRRISAHYSRLLFETPGLTIPFQRVENVDPSYHIYPVLLDREVDRTALIVKLRDKGVQTSIHYPAIQRFSAYVDENLGGTPVANDISERELTLPLYPTMSEDDVDYVVDALEGALG